MNLLVESGATKSSWLLFDQQKVIDKQVHSGINPTSNPHSIRTVYDFSYGTADQIEEVYYYGAGISSPESKNAIEQVFTDKFGPLKLHCNNDILAASRAVSDSQESIVSILGTGANSVLYDGNEITIAPRSLGYMISEYGSGCHIGRVLIQKYLHHQMSEGDTNLFTQLYIEGQGDLVNRIYASERPNYFMASFTKFLLESSVTLREEVLDEVFEAFFRKQIPVLENIAQYSFNFVGSVAKAFEKELRRKAAELNYEIDTVCGDPLDRLLAYHQKRIE